MKRLIFPPFVSGRGAIGLLLVRCVTGLAFMFHGWPKIQNPLGWMGPEAPTPGVLQFLAALSEFGGGFALIVGLLTPLAALGLAGTMATALGMVHIPMGHPFVAGGPGQPSFELAAVYLANVLLLLLTGPGVLSIDALVFGERPPPSAG